jgi:hypothetical protein
MSFYEFYRGQETASLQSVPVEFVGWRIGGCDQRNAAAKQTIEKPAKNHRIANITDKEFVKAQHPGVTRNIGCDSVQRVLNALKALKASMDVMHHAMEVDAPFPLHGERVEEEVHNKGLAAADSAPDIRPLDRLDLPVAPQAQQRP